MQAVLLIPVVLDEDRSLCVSQLELSLLQGRSQTADTTFA